MKRTKAEVRRLLAAPKQEQRADKRTSYIDSLPDAPRHEGQTFLEQQAVWDDCARDYSLRMTIFMDWTSQNQRSLATAALIDVALTLFLNEGFLQGWELAEATKFLAAVIDSFPMVAARHCLTRARRALQGWKNMDPGRTRPPLHWFLVALLTLNMVAAGNGQEALVIFYLFQTYCRHIEALKLLEKHFILPPLSNHHVVHLHSSDMVESSKTAA